MLATFYHRLMLHYKIQDEKKKNSKALKCPSFLSHSILSHIAAACFKSTATVPTITKTRAQGSRWKTPVPEETQQSRDSPTTTATLLCHAARPRRHTPAARLAKRSAGDPERETQTLSITVPSVSPPLHLAWINMHKQIQSELESPPLSTIWPRKRKKTKKKNKRKL